jgi:hypothetical protein
MSFDDDLTDDEVPPELLAVRARYEARAVEAARTPRAAVPAAVDEGDDIKLDPTNPRDVALLAVKANYERGLPEPPADVLTRTLGERLSAQRKALLEQDEHAEAPTPDAAAGLEVHPPEAYRPPAPPEGQQWDGAAMRELQVAASDFRLPRDQFAEWVTTFAGRLRAPEADEIAAGERRLATARVLRGQWGAAWAARLNQSIAALAPYPRLRALLNQSGLGDDPEFIGKLDAQVQRLHHRNRIAALQRQHGREKG